MKKFVSVLFIFSLLFCSNIIVAEENFQPTTITRKPLILSKGFAFKGKAFQVASVKVFEVSLKNLKTNKTDGKPRIIGHLELAADRHMLKVISPNPKNFEADIVRPSEKDDLNVPIGHISLKASQPDPKNSVLTGELRIIIEGDKELSGEFKVYLNLKNPDPEENDKEPQKEEE
jgi:hypothetical protein